MFTAMEAHSLINRADEVLHPMILLGIYGGMGNTDVAELPLDAVDLHEGWIDYPRPKTEVPRPLPPVA